MPSVMESQVAEVATPAGTVVARTIADEAETYNSSVAGIDIDAVRAGQGVGPSHVLAAIGERFTFTESKFGFPMLSRTTIPDDLILLAYIRSAPPGCRMCEIDLEPGAILAYAPEAEHTARNLPGLDFMFAVTDRQQLEEHAEQLGVHLEPPPRGEVHLLGRTPRTELVGHAFPAFADAASGGAYPSAAHGDDVLRAMTHALSEEDRDRRVGCANRIDSRHVIHDCINYAASIGRVPSITELCLIAHVSERRLREAFTEEFDLPPSRFLRTWALDEAHRRLRIGNGRSETVTDIAVALGFHHLGRFSGHYKQIYGECPSTTLNT